MNGNALFFVDFHRFTKFNSSILHLLPYCFIFLFQEALSGQPLFAKTYGGSGVDAAQDVVFAPDGGYLCVGLSTSSNGNLSGNKGQDDLWLVKLDSAGNLEWQKNLGSTTFDRGYSVLNTTDGGYLAGATSSGNNLDVSGNHGGADLWVLKLSSTGDVQWKKCYGSMFDEGGSFLAHSGDGNYILAGYAGKAGGDVSISKGGSDFWVVKFDTSGNILWEKSFGGSSPDYLSSVAISPEGNIVAVGQTYSDDGDVTNYYASSDYWITYLSPSGVLIWQKTLGGTLGDEPKDVMIADNGDVLVVGGSYSKNHDISENYGQKDAFIARLSAADGHIIWARNYGGSNEDIAYTVGILPNGEFLVGGYSRSVDHDLQSPHYGNGDIWVFRLDNEGTYLGDKRYGGSKNDQVHQILIAADGGYAIAGRTESSNHDIAVNKGIVDLLLMYIPVATSQTSEEPGWSQVNMTLGPNPVKDELLLAVDFPEKKLNLSFHLMDNWGKTVKHIEFATPFETRIPMHDIQAGIYYYVFKERETGKNMARGKIVLQQ